jgi:transposase
MSVRRKLDLLQGALLSAGRYGHSRDERRGKPQLVFGILADAQGCPVAVEVFEGTPPWPPRLPSCASALR